jgi:hypothetical protein
MTFQQVLGLSFYLHVKRGLVFLWSSLVSVLLHILGRILTLVFCHVPLSTKLKPSFRADGSLGNGEHPLFLPVMGSGKIKISLTPYPLPY